MYRNSNSSRTGPIPVPAPGEEENLAELDDIVLDDEKKAAAFQQQQQQLSNREYEEKKIVQALDRRMLPLFCVFYFTDYLDRANIGNAALEGIQEDLKLSPSQLGTAISAFYITYILFEVPSNVVLKQTSAVIWLSTIMLAWGAITLAMGFITSFGGLMAARLLLGAAESGYIPGILYQMSRVYKPRELSSRVAFLLCMAFLSGIVSGPIAYGTSFLEGRNGLHGWQYLFILEGVPTIVLSIVSYFCLFDSIDQVSWLTPEQKRLQHQRMEEVAAQHGPTTINLATFRAALGDWKTWLFSFVYMLNAVNFSSFSIFLPMIIDGFGFSVVTSQLMTAPPNIVSVIMVIVGGYIVDKYNRRAVVLATGFSIMALGYFLLYILRDRWALYGALFVLPVGMALQASTVVSWSAINFPDLSVRAVAVAVVVMIGNTGGVIASYLYPSTTAPHYFLGNGINLTCAIVGAMTSVLTGFLLYRENRRRDMQSQRLFLDAKEHGEDEKAIRELEDISYRFYY